MSFPLSTNAFARLLLALALMLAIPVQGFAASAMLLCGMASPSGHAGMSGPSSQSGLASPHHGSHQMAHDHSAGDMADAAVSDPGAHHGHGDKAGDPAAKHGKCSTCASCCMGAAMVSALVPQAPASMGSVMIPFTPQSFADHTPAGLDPPPRSFLA